MLGHVVGRELGRVGDHEVSAGHGIAQVASELVDLVEDQPAQRMAQTEGNPSNDLRMPAEFLETEPPTHTHERHPGPNDDVLPRRRGRQPNVVPAGHQRSAQPHERKQVTPRPHRDQRDHGHPPSPAHPRPGHPNSAGRRRHPTRVIGEPEVGCHRV